ncbi:SDR family oxidoreductase [Microbacterium sp. NPDC091313]
MDANETTVALIVGAATPVGRSVSEALADVGARLLLTDVNDAHLTEVVDDVARRTGRRPERLALRVTDPLQWSRAVDAARDRFGRLDVVVNAAEYDPAVAWEAATADDWSRAIDINLLGVVHGVDATLPALRESAGAFVVVVSGDRASGPLRATARAGAAAFVAAIGEGLADVHVATAVVSAGSEHRAGGRIVTALRSGVASIPVD